MKLVSYLRDGAVRGGVVVDGRIAEISIDPGPGSVLRRCIDAGLSNLDARAISEATIDLDTVELLPPIPDPTKIVCVGVNYLSHRNETKRDAIAWPTTFIRFADTQIGHDSVTTIPDVVERYDYEGELAVVISTTADRVDEDKAMDHVAGYACYNDFSARDWQRHGAQWTPGKNFAGTGAFGPWLVTPDEIDDIESCRLETRVNDEVRQRARIGDMLFGIPRLISYISTFTVLSPGDVIVTGTPGGVGLFREPPEFLEPGDVVEVEIDGVGLLRNVVA